MPVTVTTVGPFYTTPGSEISFSLLRENFKEVGVGSISASTLLRDARPTSKNPVVPDATENAGISSTTNWKASQFRNSIKYYNITHTGTETNYNLVTALTWNSNLNKTIVKSVYLDGTYGSSDVNNPAVKIEAETRNVKLYINGEILGAGGKAGTALNSETKGGDALSVKSDGNQLIVIPKGSIFGGGGGGARGADGLQGSSGNCNFYTFYTATTSCGSLPTCGDDFLSSNSTSGSCNCSTFCTEIYYAPPEPPGSSGSGGYTPPSPPACVSPETLILMADGSQKKAGDLKIGDVVKTKHEDTLEWGEYPVLNIGTFIDARHKLVFERDQLICSKTHKMYVDGKGWIETDSMTVGDVVSDQNLIKIVPHTRGEVVAITIDRAHAYISNNLLSHNYLCKGGGCTPSSSGPPFGCPDPDTLILMGDGSQKRAGDLQVGDLILTQHEKTFAWGRYKITEKELSEQPKYRLKFTSQEIIVSESHSFYVEGRKWTNTWNLNIGDIISGQKLISSEKIGTGTVVNIEVAEAHTYVAANLLSHNLTKTGNPPTPPTPPYTPPVSPPRPDPPRRPPDPPRGGKSDIRLKTNIRDITFLFKI